MGAAKRNRAGHRTRRECLECGETFLASRRDAITCSNACRARRGRRLRWKQMGNMRFRDVEAQPDNPMFGRLHVTLISDPETENPRVRQSPYVHSPEAGTPEAADVPWIIHVPIGPESETEVEENPSNE